MLTGKDFGSVLKVQFALTERRGSLGRIVGDLHRLLYPQNRECEGKILDPVALPSPPVLVAGCCTPTARARRHALIQFLKGGKNLCGKVS